jgi:hypothetical protein
LDKLKESKCEYASLSRLFPPAYTRQQSTFLWTGLDTCRARLAPHRESLSYSSGAWIVVDGLPVRRAMAFPSRPLDGSNPHRRPHKDRARFEVPARSGDAKEYMGIVRDCSNSTPHRKGSAARLTSARGCAFRQVPMATEKKSSVESLLIIMAVI